MSKETANLNNMMCLDVYLASLTKSESLQLLPRIKPAKAKPYPLMGWDIFWMHTQLMTDRNKKAGEAAILETYTAKFNWQLDIQAILEADYQALVLTNTQQNIQWVNKGFTDMTGYSSKYALGKTPKFLQGINTSKTISKKIQHQLLSNQPFTETVVNYRKNNEEYQCEITVFPVTNDKNETTHFLALEREKQE